MGRRNILLNISVLMSLMMEFRIGFNTYSARYAKTFLRIIAMMTITTMVPSALIEPASVFTCSFNHAYSSLSGHALKRLVIAVLLPVLKITCKKGASITRENNAKTADKMLKKKYKPTRAG